MRSGISVKTGTEGPRHDPYSYTEYTVRRPGFDTTVIHLGLGEWFKRGTEMVHCSMDRKGFGFGIEDACGFTVTQIDRIVRKLEESRYRAHKAHGGFEWQEGYPGEAFCMCKCGKCIDSTFNESAII